ncbi:hypothetical protein VTN77DRAFT_9433 [Rasamsonia byssochlamydoides]|uniref:uncharacterized protein n=1 Tax=Rasamsonia byssochlamydoides TaxID=89139 RepID=UPI0037439D25
MSSTLSLPSTPSSISTAQVALYTIIILPSLYCLFRHGKRGILGWGYLIIFCTVRIVAGGMDLSNSSSNSSSSSSSTGALIVDNIGLSPLILAAVWVLHEARNARSSITNPKHEWARILIFHISVSTALALVAVGVSNLANAHSSSDSSSDSGSSTLKAGFGVLFLCWLVLSVWTLLSFRSSSSSALKSRDRYNKKNNFADGTTLLYSVLVSIPLILLRGIYGAITLFSSKPTSFSSDLAANVCMSVVPQLLAAVVFAGAGIVTRNMHAGSGSRSAYCSTAREDPSERIELARRGQADV